MSNPNEGRTWYDGRPPHIGWWLTDAQVMLQETPHQRHQTSISGWRWWDGHSWSRAAFDFQNAISAARMAEQKLDRLSAVKLNVRWCRDWPGGARVPRVDPEHRRITGKGFMPPGTTLITYEEGRAIGPILHAVLLRKLNEGIK